ncbi:MAG TPA: aminotransferase class V-fold PLP-dependent enzyme [Woeseiaceae bacterium]|nr:aminotransferase class V-fold PLP-dependent enzyme [Woeseiaceae bacterium]
MALVTKSEIDILQAALEKLQQGFSRLPDFTPDVDQDRIRSVLMDVAGRMQQNYPYHHPRYAGQMLKPPHPVARLAYALSLWINPNNHARDGGMASSLMESECVAAIGAMFGLGKPLGHLCGGGTMANLEALWVAGQLHPGKTVLASAQAHYTHARISDVLALPFEAIPVTADGCMDMTALESRLREGDVAAVVATMGTTGLGAIDPLPAVLHLRQQYGFRLHVDAAYGGYFTLADALAPEVQPAFARMGEADSIVIDPHKHGLQPYGCGCVLFRDPTVGALYKHDSPYTYFSSAELHLGEISLECSRPGAAAVALWATQQLLPMQRGGEFASGLNRSLLAARELWRRVRASRRFKALLQPQLDIVVFGVRAGNARDASALARKLFAETAKRELHLALIEIPGELVRHYWPELIMNRDTVTCVRSCMMKPEHLDWIDDIWSVLESAALALDD